MTRKILAEDCLLAAEAAKNDPYVFFGDFLGMPKEKFTEDQRRIIDAYMQHKYVAVVSGNGTGKTHVSGCSLLTCWHDT